MRLGAVSAYGKYLEPKLSGLTNMQRAIVVMCFVQDAIDYETDVSQYGTEEFWATPMESMFLGYGDCEDGAILFVSIASAMGIDCGFVTFDSDRYGTDGTGHMSIAIALENDEHITGTDVATFVVDGVTYVYGETAVDPVEIDNVHPMFGMLGSSYSIADGLWTHIVYSDGTFTAESTLNIGNGERSTGRIVYGDSYSNPPAVPMRVGDGFSYTPETTLPATFVATGDGMAENGGFLHWNDATRTLSGTAVSPGTYTVVLTATTIEGPEQTAVQTVTLVVEEASADSGSSDHYLIYGDGVWNVESTESGTQNTDAEADDGSDNTTLYIVAALIVVAGIIIAWRVI